MIAVRAPSLSAIQRRLDAIALQQLRAECARLAAENDQLRDEVYWAEQAAESWREDAMRLLAEACEATGGTPGLTIDGALVVAPGGAA